MAKIVDPDQLNQTTEVIFVPGSKTIQLLVAGNLSDTAPRSGSGVSLQAVYSFCKEEWRQDSGLFLNRYRFPIKAIYEAKFIMVNTWGWLDVTTRGLLRDAGWQETDLDEWACFISLGSMDDDAVDQAYFTTAAGFAQSKADFGSTGQLNEAIQINDEGVNDYRNYNKAFLREELKTFDEYNILVEQGYSALTYIAYRLPLSNADDTSMNPTYDDTYVEGANEPFQSMEMQYYIGHTYDSASAKSYTLDEVGQDVAGRWFRCTTAGTLDAAGVTDYTTNGGTGVFGAYEGERQVGPVYYAFNRAVVCNVSNKADTEEYYAFCQHRNRQATDINDDSEILGYGTVYGNVAIRLAYFVGTDLHGWAGVCFDNYDPNITSLLKLHDITVDSGGLDSEDVPIISTLRTYPFVSAGNMVFNDDLKDDADGKFWMYFKDANGNQFDSATAIIVQDDTDTDITGAIPTNSIAFTFDYAGNAQGGRTPGTDAIVIVVAQGLNGAEWVEGEFLITENVGLAFPVNAPTERNYSNP